MALLSFFSLSLYPANFKAVEVKGKGNKAVGNYPDWVVFDGFLWLTSVSKGSDDHSQA